VALTVDTAWCIDHENCKQEPGRQFKRVAGDGCNNAFDRVHDATQLIAWLKDTCVHFKCL